MIYIVVVLFCDKRLIKIINILRKLNFGVIKFFFILKKANMIFRTNCHKFYPPIESVVEILQQDTGTYPCDIKSCYLLHHC